MTIDIGGISVSIPTRISDWVHESADNKTEFDGMIESIMYAVKNFIKKNIKPILIRKYMKNKSKNICLWVKLRKKQICLFLI